ncbi:heat-inducible transcriptional repressor HrcA [Rubrimonas cliftonensis]|uniref:Heat-inducible transcription repressor HrcA n=1 Tax=Rubrimonas cliftonensis TaxID=89524 RepID=A0A1H4F9J7_9RHOB|nr:heat-inducible transcriptional repressor HrcA [Rubrimonas cliftonensis]SEA93577.1 heat-inducible transcription repressor HrcA [Rubrimonas cliftonensis]
MNETAPILADMNARARDVFRQLVETYLETGDPVGSRTLSRQMGMQLSPASIRNVMQDLEALGMLDSPHASAGRVPTHLGLRMFVDGLLEIGDIDEAERGVIDQAVGGASASVADMLDEAGAMLSGLSQCASLVIAPKAEAPIRHIEFVSIAADRALAVLVTQDGDVENRLFAPPPGMTPSAMREAANFLNATLQGRTLTDAGAVVASEIARRRAELDALAADLVEQGLAAWSGEQPGGGIDRLIVRGRANLLDGAQDLDRMRQLFDDLERKRDLAQLLDLASDGEGVRIFIGAENKLFSLSGSSLVISPYMNAERKLVGAIGVIGPTRLNYGRIVPIVDYTARLVGRMVAERKTGPGGRNTR